MPPSGRCRAALLLALFAAGASLAQPRPASPPPTEVEGKSLSQWLAELRSNDPSSREEAIRAIALFGPPDATTVTALIDRLTDRDGSPRIRAVLALAALDVPKADVPRVVEALGKRVNSEHEPQSAVRYQAAVALARYAEDARPAIPGLLKACEDQATWEIRRVAVAALAVAGHGQGHEVAADTRAARALINALKDPAFGVRLEAIIGLGYMGRIPDPALQSLAETHLKALQADRDKVTSIWANYAVMALTKSDDAVLLLIARQLKSPEVRVRCHAARALGSVGAKAKAHVPDLCDMLRDKEVSAVVTACWALGRLGSDAVNAVVFLKEMAESQDGDERVRAAAKAALDAIRNPDPKRKP